MASAGTTRAAAAALLLSLSAVLLFLLLQTPPRGLADHVAAALDCFLDWRGLLELATRRNMILLCHAILLVILRDAGVLGTPAGRRSQSHSRSPPAAVAQQTASSVAPARSHATGSAVVVWRRRPRNRAAGAAAPRHDAVAARRRLVECQCQPAVETWAAPLLTTGPQARATEEAAAVATEQQIVLAQPPRNEAGPLEHHRGRDAVVGPPAEHPTAIAVGGDDRRIATDDEKRMDDGNGDGDGMEMIAASPHARRREQQTAGMETGMEMELADDRTFEEFIKSQRRQMRQESLKLLISSGYHYHAIAA
jgi:hypothetical protein